MRFVPALLLDAVLVLIFAAIGRASHSEDPLGFLATAWPFLVALLLGHAIAALLPGRPRRPWTLAWGAVVWIVTVAGGMLLRVASGDTAQLPFVIVATITLGVFLLGWRAAAALFRRRASRTGSTDAADSSAGAVAYGGAAEHERDRRDSMDERPAVDGDGETRDAASPDPVQTEPSASDREPAVGDSAGADAGSSDSGGTDFGGDAGGGDSGGSDSGGGDSGGGGSD